MKENIKVLHIISSLHQGGAERQLLELVKNNNQHAVCQLFSGGIYEKELKENNYFDKKSGKTLFDESVSKPTGLKIKVAGCSFTTSINAQGTSPHFSSGLATTAAIETLGCLAKVFSISIDDMFSPPEIIISFDLSLIFM